MDHVNQTKVFGQIAEPSKPGKYPALLQLQWAGGPYALDKSWITPHASNGWIALNIQAHNVFPTEPASYYNALPATLKSYNRIGHESRETSYFVEMYLRGVRAVDYLRSHPNWDGKTLLVMGTSMGGQQTLAVAGLHPGITHMMANVPAGCDVIGDLYGRQSGYPYFPYFNAKVAEASPYVDCTNFASRIRATSLVAMGFVDTVTPPAGIWAAYNLIRGRKEVAPMPESPHNNLATAEQSRPWITRSQAWLKALVEGKDPISDNVRP
jgi:cephalosporin-C deacetylase